jgi:N-acetylmuramoyl-L-alanine amidase
MAVLTYQEGSRGAAVKQIQKAIGCYPDGIWGKLTTECLKTWQSDHGLTPDGIAGPRTLTALGIDAAVSGLKGSNGSKGSSGSSSHILTSYAGKTIDLRRSKRRIDEIIIHCTATREGRELTVEQIRQDHTAPVSQGGRGWSDIGYHYVVYLDGTVHEGRDIDIAGAHCTNQNAHSIGIVYVGGLEYRNGVPYAQLRPKDTRTEAQKASLLALLVDLRKLYPSARIYGHRDFARKDCPCFDAKNEYRRV